MLFKPPGATAPDSGRWDTHPERMTYFLELLATEKREGRFLQGNPNNTHYNLLIRSFWDKFTVYHTKGQFKNHFSAKKQLWSLICWAQKCTGISWDDQRKMVIASPDWWEANKERKGLWAIKDKPIPDYDLLEFVFMGQHAEGANLRDPHVPRYPRPEVVVESQQLSDIGSQDNPTPGRVNVTPTSDPQRVTGTPTYEPRKKKRNTTITDDSSPIVERLNNIMGGWFDKMTEARIRRQESKKTVDSVNTRPKSYTAVEVARILLGEMNMDATSSLFQEAQDLFDEKEFLRAILMEQKPETRWPWLINTLERRSKTQQGTPTKGRIYEVSSE